MISKPGQPRATISFLDANGEVVPILDEGAMVSIDGDQYREYWTEEEDLIFLYQLRTLAPDGSYASEEWVGGVHGNIGYELLIDLATRQATLRLDYFGVSPCVVGDRLDLAYEPMSTTVKCVLDGSPVKVEVAMQPGLREDGEMRDLVTLRLECR